MRLLLDESVPSRLRRALPNHAVRTVGEIGWSGVKNGRICVRVNLGLTLGPTLQSSGHPTAGTLPRFVTGNSVGVRPSTGSCSGGASAPKASPNALGCGTCSSSQPVLRYAVAIDCEGHARLLQPYAAW